MICYVSGCVLAIIKRAIPCHSLVIVDRIYSSQVWTIMWQARQIRHLKSEKEAPSVVQRYSSRELFFIAIHEHDGKSI